MKSLKLNCFISNWCKATPTSPIFLGSWPIPFSNFRIVQTGFYHSPICHIEPDQAICHQIF